MYCPKLYLGATYNSDPYPPDDNPAFTFFPHNGVQPPDVAGGFILGAVYDVRVNVKNDGNGGRIAGELFLTNHQPVDAPKLENRIAVVEDNIPPLVAKDFTFQWAVDAPPGSYRLLASFSFIGRDCLIVPSLPYNECKTISRRLVHVIG